MAALLRKVLCIGSHQPLCTPQIWMAALLRKVLCIGSHQPLCAPLIWMAALVKEGAENSESLTLVYPSNLDGCTS